VIPLKHQATAERDITQEYARHVQVMKALSDPTRLRILQSIASESEYACTALENQVPIGKSTISYHIKLLSGAGLITVRREGKFFFYSAELDVLAHYSPSLLRLLLRGDAL
jgi:DNA-binding transcriptional ArsR family regulator